MNIDNNQNLALYSVDEKYLQQLDTVQSNELRKTRGVIKDKNDKEVCGGSFVPFEFNTHEMSKLTQTALELQHDLKDMIIGYAFECTIIRVFHHENKWYISTHRKIDASRSSWGSNTSFKILFGEGLQKDYNLSLEQFYALLNPTLQYTFMLMASEHTKFVCNVDPTNKHVYLIKGSSELPIERVPKSNLKFTTYEDIFKHVHDMKHPGMYAGVILIHTSGTQYRISNDEYIRMYKVRGNTSSIPFRYLALKCLKDQEQLEMIRMLFPKSIPTFQHYDEMIQQSIDKIYHYYTERQKGVELAIPQVFYLFVKKLLLDNVGRQLTIKDIEHHLLLSKPITLNAMRKSLETDDYFERKLIIDLSKISAKPPVLKANPPVLKANPPVVKANPPVVKANPPVVKANPPVVKANPPVLKAVAPKKKVKFVKLPFDIIDVRCRKRLY